MTRNTIEKPRVDHPRALVGLWPVGNERLVDHRLLVTIGERIGGVSESLAKQLTRPTRYTNMSLPQLLRARPMRVGSVKREKKEKPANV